VVVEEEEEKEEEEVSLSVIMTNTEIEFHILLFTLSSSSVSRSLSFNLLQSLYCKQKQNETHYENITHFIHLTLKNTILGVLHNLFIYTHTIIYVKRKGGSFLWS
jgi:hypothetical protein